MKAPEFLRRYLLRRQLKKAERATQVAHGEATPHEGRCDCGTPLHYDHHGNWRCKCGWLY